MTSYPIHDLRPIVTNVGFGEIRCSRHSASNPSRPTRYSARFASIGLRSKGLPRNGGKSSIDAGPSAIIAHANLWVHNIHAFSRFIEG